MTPEEFRESYLTLAESFYRVAFHMLEEEADAEDAVQDLYIRLWNSRDTLGSVRNPRAYGITLLRNICIDRIRRVSAQRRGELTESLPAEGSSDTEICTREQLDMAMKAVEKLSESERQVLMMRVFDELSFEEISERTGKSGLTLRVLLSNARRKIKKAMS